ADVSEPAGDGKRCLPNKLPGSGPAASLGGNHRARYPARIVSGSGGFAMTQAETNFGYAADRLRANWGWLLALGVVLVIGGLILIAAPLASSIAITLLIAAVLVIGGLVQIYHAF